MHDPARLHEADGAIASQLIDDPHKLSKSREEFCLAPPPTSLLRHSARTTRNVRVFVVPGLGYSDFLVAGSSAHPR